MARRGLKITGGRDNIYMRDYRGTSADAERAKDTIRANPGRSVMGAVKASESGTCDGDTMSVVRREAVPTDQQA